MKAYFEGLEWYDYLISLVYNGIFSYLLYRIGEVFIGIRKKTLVILLAAFQLYFLVTLADSIWGFMPLHMQANWFALIVTSGEYPVDANVNLLVPYYFTIFLSIVCLNTPLIYIILCAGVYTLALMILLKAWNDLIGREDNPSTSGAALLFLLWPAALLFLTAPAQTSFILIGFAFFFRGWVRWVKQQKWLPFIIGAAVQIAMQPESVVWVIPVMAASWLFTRKWHAALKVGIAAAVVILAGIVLDLVLPAGISPVSLAEMRNRSIVDADVYGYGNVNWTDVGMVLRDYPFIVLQFLIAPLPIFMQFDLATAWIPAFDGIFSAILILTGCISILMHRKILKGLGWFMLLYILLIGGAEDNWMHAITARMPVILLCILLTAQLFSRNPDNSDSTQ